MNNQLQKRQSLKKALRNRKHLFANWTSVGHPSITEMMMQNQADFLGIDIEHSTISQEQAQRIIAATQSSESVCLPRIASHNMEMTKRLLDSGADGVIVPMVSNVLEVGKIVDWVKYSPVGKRSFGISRAQGYGFNFEEYISTWNDSSIIIVQIESIEGVENIEKIIANEHIDGVMIGPYDLSGSLGVPGQLNHPRIVEAAKEVNHIAEKYSKASGTQIVDITNQSMRQVFEQGYTFAVLASDVFLLWEWSERVGKLVSEYREKPF